MLIANETFDTLKSLDNQQEYECCTFRQCDLSEAFLTSTRFIECEFVECNLSNIRIDQTSFIDCSFDQCKMLGIQFDRSNHLIFSASFTNCQLDHSTFYQMKLKDTRFTNSSLEGADFTETDLKGANLTGCNLLNAKFERTNLEEADLRNAVGYAIDPEQNRIAKAQFSLSEIEGLLTRYRIKIDRNS